MNDADTQKSVVIVIVGGGSLIYWHDFVALVAEICLFLSEAQMIKLEDSAMGWSNFCLAWQKRKLNKKVL